MPKFKVELSRRVVTWDRAQLVIKASSALEAERLALERAKAEGFHWDSADYFENDQPAVDWSEEVP